MNHDADQDFDFGLGPGEQFEPPEVDDDFDTSKPHVMTAQGPIDPASLGLTLHHEHVICKPNDVGTADPDLMLDDPALAVVELEDAFSVGLRAIVDMTPADYGRDENEILWVAQRSPVHIIVVTGHHKHQHAAPHIGAMSAEDIAARNIAEIRDGIGVSGVRPGLIKAGTSLNQVTAVEDRALRAAAWTMLETGVPISTHTDRGTMALQQLSILESEGVPLNRVIVGHLDFVLDEAYLREVLATGAFVSFDQVSKRKYATDEARAAMVQSLASLGHSQQLLISGDLARKSYLRAYGGSPGLRYLVEEFPLALMGAGLDALTVRQLYVANPAEALSIQHA